MIMSCEYYCNANTLCHMNFHKDLQVARAKIPEIFPLSKDLRKVKILLEHDRQGQAVGPTVKVLIKPNGFRQTIILLRK